MTEIIDQDKMKTTSVQIPELWYDMMKAIDPSMSRTFRQLSKVYLQHHYPDVEFKIPMRESLNQSRSKYNCPK